MFMDFFRKEQKDLRKCGELTVADTLNKEDFVNLLREGIKDGVEKALASREPELQESRDDMDSIDDDEKNALMTKIEQMNATITKLQNEKQMWTQPQMQMNPMWMNSMFNPMLMNTMNSQGSTRQQNNNNNNSNNSNRNSNRRNGRRRQPGRRFDFYNRYCWSCGGCDHWGRNCGDKKPGHVDTASFRNKQGGSVDNCFVN